MNFQNSCLCGCQPTQVLKINPAIDDFSLLSIYDTNGKQYDNVCLIWSYSTDGVNWSCWESYDKTANVLFKQQSDYYIKVKIDGSIGSVKYDGKLINDYGAVLESCFDFDNMQKSISKYNPYNSVNNAMGLYQKLTETVSSIVGIPIYYFKLAPVESSKDITFKEYTLMNIDSVKQIKLIVQDNVMPSSKPEFSEFGFDFSTDWETEISKSTFATAFGINAKPMEGDLVYIPMMKRMWMVNNTYEEKNEGFMWNATTFKIGLVKYQEKSSVDLGDTQAFVDSLVQTKYDDLFGDNENLQSGSDTVESPNYSFVSTYPVFESDSLRKYVKHSCLGNPLKDLNAKLVERNIYNKGVLVSDSCYDFRSIKEESYISYQRKYIGTDATISFIITLDNNYCKGTILRLGNVYIDIDMNPTVTRLSIFGKHNIELKSGNTYLVYIRYDKAKRIFDMNAIEHIYPKDMPSYMLQKFHYSFDISNPIIYKSNYDIEFEQCEKSDIIIYSFAGLITNIKIYDEYVSNITELIQQYPTNQHLLVNDTARKFVLVQDFNV